MKIAVCELHSVSPYSQSRYYKVTKLAKELPDAYEERTWRNRLHTLPDGTVFIPPMAFANSIKEAASYLSLQIPGKGKSTWTKHFQAGVLVAEALVLPMRASEVESEWLFVPADGTRGGGRRVEKCFPVIREWSGSVTYYILDDMITEDVFTEHLRVAGSLIGIGRFRPRNCGYYGRYSAEGITWKVQAEV